MMDPRALRANDCVAWSVSMWPSPAPSHAQSRAPSALDHAGTLAQVLAVLIQWGCRSQTCSAVLCEWCYPSLKIWFLHKVACNRVCFVHSAALITVRPRWQIRCGYVGMVCGCFKAKRLFMQLASVIFDKTTVLQITDMVYKITLAVGAVCTRAAAMCHVVHPATGKRDVCECICVCMCVWMCVLCMCPTVIKVLIWTKICRMNQKQLSLSPLKHTHIKTNTRLPCNKRCEKLLPCGHRCASVCGEVCAPELCVHPGCMAKASDNLKSQVRSSSVAWALAAHKANHARLSTYVFWQI